MPKSFDTVEIVTKSSRTITVGLNEYVENVDGTWRDGCGDDVDDDVQSLLEAILELWEAAQIYRA